MSQELTTSGPILTKRSVRESSKFPINRQNSPFGDQESSSYGTEADGRSETSLRKRIGPNRSRISASSSSLKSMANVEQIRKRGTSSASWTTKEHGTADHGGRVERTNPKELQTNFESFSQSKPLTNDLVEVQNGTDIIKESELQNEPSEAVSVELNLPILDFKTPPKSSLDEFDSRLFLRELAELLEKLEALDSRQELELHECQFTDIFSNIAGLVEHFKMYSKKVGDMCSSVRDVTVTIRSKALKQFAKAKKDSVAKTESQKRSCSVLETELLAKQHQLIRDLAKVLEDLHRAELISVEAEKTSLAACLAAERTAEEARTAQEQCETERQTKQEERDAEVARKALEEMEMMKLAKRFDEERQADVERPDLLRRNRERFAEDLDWPTFTYKTGEGVVDFPGDVVCTIRGDPNWFTMDSVTCRPVPLSESGFVYGDLEELISNIVQIKPADNIVVTKEALVVAIPYYWSQTPASVTTREPVLKALSSDGVWEEQRSKQISVDHQKFIEAKFVRFTKVAVVMRYRKEYGKLASGGGSVTSRADHNVTIQCDRGTFDNLEHFTFQLQPIDVDARRRLSDLRGLLGSSSIVNIRWSSRSFNGKIAVTLPVSQDPWKVSNRSTAREAKKRVGDRKLPSPSQLAKPRSTELQGDQLDEQRRSVRKWFMGQYGNSEDDDRERFFFLKKSASGKWCCGDANVEQIKVDLVQVELCSPEERFIVLRTRHLVSADEAEVFAASTEIMMAQRPVCSIIRQRSDDECRAVHVLVPQHRLERVRQHLDASGFTKESVRSTDIILLKEGERLSITTSYNIQLSDADARDGRPPISIVYNSNLEAQTHLILSPMNASLRRGVSEYRGTIQIWKTSEDAGQTRTDKGTPSASDDALRDILVVHTIHIPKVNTVIPLALYDRTSSDNSRASAMDNITQKSLLRLVRKLEDLEWLEVAKELGIKDSYKEIYRQKAAANSWSETRMRYELLASWFKRQPKANNKLDALGSALYTVYRDDLERELKIRPFIDSCDSPLIDSLT